MDEKQKFENIAKHLEKLEIRGSENIQVMYNLLGYIYQEIKILDEQSKSPPKQEG